MKIFRKDLAQPKPPTSASPDSDADGDALSVTAGTLTTTQGGSVILSANGDFTYTPVADFFGADSFVYTVSDGNGGTDAASVVMLVLPSATLVFLVSRWKTFSTLPNPPKFSPVETKMLMMLTLDLIFPRG